MNHSAFTPQMDDYIVKCRNYGDDSQEISRKVREKFSIDLTNIQINNHLGFLRRRYGIKIKTYPSGYKTSLYETQQVETLPLPSFNSSGKVTVRVKLKEYACKFKAKWPKKPIVLCLPGKEGIDLPIYFKLNAEVHAVERDHKIAEHIRRTQSSVIVHECDLSNLNDIGNINFAFLDFCGYFAKDNLAGLHRTIKLLAINSLLAVTFVATRWHKKYQEHTENFGHFRKPYQAAAHIVAEALPNGYGLHDVKKYVYWSKHGFTMATVMGTFDRTLLGSSRRELEHAWIKV